MNSNDNKMVPQKQEAFTLGPFRPDDAEGMVRLFCAVYGESYPIRLFYDPAAIITANREGQYYSICARTASGEVIGVTHLYLSAPYQPLYEWGAGLVLKEYRNLGINNQLADFLHNEFVSRNPHIEELFGEPVCNHLHLQKSVISFKYVETAVEVALMPAAAYDKEKSASGRVATLAAFRCYKPKPHRVFLPAVYEAILRRIYDRLDDARDLLVSYEELPHNSPTRAEMNVFDFAGVARIAIHECGDDLKACLSGLESQAQKKNAVVFQVSLNLTQPWVGMAVDILRDAGYFFGGALPRWFDGDGFLMQKLLCPPYFESIVLLSDFSKQLLEIVKKDFQRADCR